MLSDERINIALSEVCAFIHNNSDTAVLEGILKQLIAEAEAPLLEQIKELRKSLENKDNEKLKIHEHYAKLRGKNAK